MVDPAVLTDQKQLLALNRERSHVENVLEVGREYRAVKLAIDEASIIMVRGTDSQP